ncbi:cobalt ABC transporter permease [Sporomusaceae bacterium FL31]|nr:cobalt ABC transporter permease [Sporomusaceae bacterium FL31]GCE34051.1 cobalt ABC transporter permease [Sporomusaceae bacterium]
MYNKNVWEAVPGNTWVHKLDVRTKLVVLLCCAVLVVLLDSPRTLYLLFCTTLVLHGMSGASLARWRVLLMFVMLGIWGSMVSQALFYSQEPRTIVACLLLPSAPLIGTLTGGVYIYREGLEYGAIQALRSASMLSMGLLISWTSDPRQLLRSFLSWKMPYELAFMLITSLRFLPVIFQETAVVLTAQRLRGFEPLRSLVPRRLIQAAFQTLFPILARTLRRAVTLAFSVESRGFGRKVNRLGVGNWPWGQWLGCALLLASLLGLLLLKVMDVLQFNGIRYFPEFRQFYDLMKVWM